MPIQSQDIKLLKSQVLLDTSDGGGYMTANQVVDGQSNNLFPDVSELDRTYGRVALRKVYTAVDTSNVDSYYGVHTIISKVPQDPRVSVTMFTTKSWSDRRNNARDKIERYLARGPKWPGHLLEMQLEGQRAIQQAVRPADEEPKVGQGLDLVQFEGLGTEYEQYVRVTRVSSILRVFTVNGKDVTRKVLTIEISDPLRFNFEGPTVEQFENGNLGKAVTRDTRVANAATYYGASKLAVAGALNDASIQAEGIFSQLVPSAQSETPMVDLTAAALSSLYVPSSTGVIVTTVNAPIGPNTKLFIGSPVTPGSLSLVANGNTFIDVGGLVKLGSTEVGLIEYDKGLLNFNANAPTYSGNMALTFKPAATPARLSDTASISIVQDTRGLNYTITLLPIPMPASLVVSYTAQGKVYYLYDKGDGVLRGSDPGFGVGNINYATGSVILTVGALPDASSEIIFAWGKAATTFVRSSITVAPAQLRFTLANPQVAPGTLALAWMVGAVAKAAADDGNGNIVGDATGKINYASGKMSMSPALLVSKGTQITANYQFGQPNEQTFANLVRDGAGNLVIQVPNLGGNILPKSVEVDWELKVDSSTNLTAIFSDLVWNPLPYFATRPLAV
jgi:hypothetical protein